MIRETFTLRDKNGQEGSVVFEYDLSPAWKSALASFLIRVHRAQSEVEVSTSGMRLGGLHVAEHRTEEIES